MLLASYRTVPRRWLLQRCHLRGAPRARHSQHGKSGPSEILDVPQLTVLPTKNIRHNIGFNVHQHQTHLLSNNTETQRSHH